MKCNPDAWKKGPLDKINTSTPSIYVGETARSVQERALEHWKGYKSRDPDNHIMKHMTLHHTQGEEPQFVMKVVVIYALV